MRNRVEFADLSTLDAEIRRRAFAYDRSRNRRSRNAGTPATVAAPVTPLTIFGQAAMPIWLRADLGITIGTGVAAWADQSGNGNNFANGTGASQFALTANDATLNNQATVLADGVDDFIANATANLGALPITIIMIAKQVTWTGGRFLCCSDSLASTLGLILSIASPGIRQINTSQVNLQNALAIGTWGRVQAQFTNSAADLLRALAPANDVTGGNAGAGVATGFRLAKQGGASTAFGNVAFAEVMVLNVIPTAQNNTDLSAYITARYGAGLT